MILGKGDIASVIPDREGALLFASGVSNSAETLKGAFDREIKLLNKQRRDLCLFYFSTLSIFYKNSPYVEHKKHMEDLIRDQFPNYNIIRIGNITWGDNPNTFLNYFRIQIKAKKHFTIFDEYRYLICKQEFLTVVNNLPLIGKNEVNVCGEILKVEDIVKRLIDENNY